MSGNLHCSKPAKISTKTRIQRRLRQRGLSLVEISLALALVGITTAFTARSMLRESQNLLARSESQTLLDIQKGLQAYLDENGLHLVTKPAEAIQRRISVGSSVQVTMLNAGFTQGSSFWPSLTDLRDFRLLPSQLQFISIFSNSRPYVTGPILAYPLGDNENPLPQDADTIRSHCLQYGCYLRQAAFPQPTVTLAPNQSAANPPIKVSHLLLNLLGNRGVMTWGTDGRFVDNHGTLRYRYSENGEINISEAGDVGILAEVQIPPVNSSSNLQTPYLCPAGYFGFTATGTGSSTDYTEHQNTSPTRCVAAHGDIPSNQQIVVHDLRSPYTGYIRLTCMLAEDETLVVKTAQDAASLAAQGKASSNYSNMPLDSSCTP